MSVTGPGCAACNFKGFVPWASEPGMEGAIGDKPCDRCGGWSQFAAPVVGIGGVQGTVRRHPSPETDWRLLPSCAEVLAHNARTGGEAFAPWLRSPAGDDAVACVVMLAALDREATPGVTAKVVVELLGGERLPYPGDTYRPITRCAEALPWPEVPR